VEHGASYTIPRTVVTQTVAGQLVLLDLASEQYYGLDSIGAQVVSLVTERPWQDALDEMGRIYDVDPETLRNDVLELIGEMVAAGLLTPVDDASS
jgi:hypothetical protein